MDRQDTHRVNVIQERRFRLAVFVTALVLSVILFAMAAQVDGDTAWNTVFPWLVVPVLLSSIFVPWPLTAALIAIHGLGMMLWPALFDNLSVNLTRTLVTSLTSVLAALAVYARSVWGRDQSVGHATASSDQAQQALLSAIPDLIFRLNREGIFVDYKPSALELYAPPDAFLGRSMRDVLPQLADETMTLVERVLATGDVQTMRYALPTNGQERRYEARISPFGDDEVIVIVRDVTELEQAQEALLESQRRLTMALQAGGYALWDWDVRTGQVIRDPHWARLLGYEPEEIASTLQAGRALIHPDDEPEAVATFEALIRGEVAFAEYEYRLRTRAGDYVWVHDHGIAVERDEAGRALRVIGLQRDITASRHAQETEHERRAFLEALRDTASIIGRTLELDDLLELVLIQVTYIVPHDAAVIMLVEEGVGHTA